MVLDRHALGRDVDTAAGRRSAVEEQFLVLDEVLPPLIGPFKRSHGRVHVWFMNTQHLIIFLFGKNGSIIEIN